jgi:hypothetical protein
VATSVVVATGLAEPVHVVTGKTAAQGESTAGAGSGGVLRTVDQGSACPA